MRSGYHLIVFGYGYSGAGKTYTLLGKDIDSGLTQRGLMYLFNAQSGVKIEMAFAFELYSALSEKSGDENILYLGQVINLFNEAKQQGELFGELKANITSASDIDKIMKDITNYRKKKDRIRATINNPESSRSHLFVRFKCTFPDNSVGMLTLVDAGGQENPVEIANEMIFRNSSNIALSKLPFVAKDIPQIIRAPWTKTSAYQPKPIVFTPTLKKALTETEIKALIALNADPRLLYKRAIKTIKEGFYINETLNHLRWFLLKQQDLVVEEAVTLNVFDNNPKVQVEYVPGNNFVDPASKESASVFMKPVFDALFNEKPGKTKFVMIAALNPNTDVKHCSSSIKTLEYAQSVKST